MTIEEKISKAIISISGRDLMVKENMAFSTFFLKKLPGEKISFPIKISFSQNGNILQGKYFAYGIIEKNFKGKKVHAFKMKNRTRTRRLRGSRPCLSQVKILEFSEGEKINGN